jgi:hypothetical protein
MDKVYLKAENSQNQKRYYFKDPLNDIIMEFDQVKIVSTVRENIEELRRNLDHIYIEQECQIDFPSTEFRTPKQIDNIVKNVKTMYHPVIYRLDCGDDSARRQLIQNYKDFDQLNRLRTRGKDRLNVSRYNKVDSETLYLGSSMKNIRKRIGQHLGAGNFRTYSLHLSSWDRGLKYSINICIYKIVSGNNVNLDRTFIELLEQGIWDYHKPIFGKRSGL